MSKHPSAMQDALAAEADRLRVSMQHELQQLGFRVERAIRNLAAGHRLDDHMIANASMLTAEIARWNMLLELQPYADDRDHGGIARDAATKETKR